MKCSKCNADYDGDIGYCSSCGATYVSSTVQKEKREKERQKEIRKSYYHNFNNEEWLDLLDNFKLSDEQKKQRVRQCRKIGLRALGMGIVFIFLVELSAVFTHSMKTDIANALLFIVPLLGTFVGVIYGWSKTTLQFIYYKRLPFKSKKKMIIYYLTSSILSLVAGFVTVYIINGDYFPGFFGKSIPIFFIVMIFIINSVSVFIYGDFMKLADIFMIKHITTIIFNLIYIVGLSVVEYCLVAVISGIIGIILLAAFLIIGGVSGNRYNHY